MDDTSKMLAKKLASLMEERNISQSQLSKDTGIQQSTISNMLPGMNDEKKLREPGYKTIIALAKYFDVSADWLMGLSPFRSTNKDNRIAAMTTGLSDGAIKTLSRMSDIIISKDDNDAQSIWCRSIIFAINALLAVDEGRDVLADMTSYFIVDFNKAYYSINRVWTDEFGDKQAYFESNNEPIKKLHFDSSVPGINKGVNLRCGIMKYALLHSINDNLEKIRHKVNHGSEINDLIGRIMANFEENGEGK